MSFHTVLDPIVFLALFQLNGMLPNFSEFES